MVDVNYTYEKTFEKYILLLETVRARMVNYPIVHPIAAEPVQKFLENTKTDLTKWDSLRGKKFEF